MKYYSKKSKKVIFSRNPFDRILSFYLEKIVEFKLPAWKTFFSELSITSKGCEEINFINFLKALIKNNSHFRNDHTMPQNKFFLFGDLKNYSHVFQLKELSSFGSKIGIPFSFDQRVKPTDGLKDAKHGLKDLKRIEIKGSESIPSYQLLNMKINGELPLNSSFQTEETLNLINRLYKEDCEIFRSFKFDRP